jgi:signal transduction histidine kinase/CheY-like chemotaxis protein
MTLTRRFSLQFAAAAGAGVALAVAAAMAVFLWRMDTLGDDLRNLFAQSIEQELRRDAEAALAALSVDAHGPLLDYDRAALERIAVSLGGVAPNARIRIYDHHGRMLTDTSEGVMGLPDSAPKALRGLTEKDGVKRWTQGEALFAGQAVCLRDVCIGAVEVAVNGAAVAAARERVDARLTDTQFDFFLQALALCLIMLLLIALGAAGIGHLLGRRLKESIDSAVAAMDAIRDGAKAVSVDVRDEQLNELASALESLAETIATERERNEKVADHLEDGLFVAQPGGRIVLANPALHALLKKPNYALFGADAYTLLALDPAEDAQSFAAAAGAVESITLDDGAVLPVLVSTRVAGEPPDEKVVGVVRDGSDLAAAQAAAHSAELRAQAAERARDEFLAVMSHELRTPLNGVLGGAAVLAGTELNNAQKKFVDIVQNSGKSMLRMVSTMLDFARMKSGDIQVEAVSTDTDGLMHAAKEAMIAAAKAKKLHVAIDIQPGAPVVLTDGEKLRQIIDAFTDNAVKFTEAGRIDLRLGYRIDGDMVGLTVTVADTGRGISAEDQSAIFGDFSQADGSARREKGGAGLGLAMAKQLADAMGAALSVRSAPGDGSTFTLQLNAPLDPAANGRGASLAGGSALVVAADEAERAALAGQLSHVGMTVTAMSAASEAMQALSAGAKPQLVVHGDDLPDLQSSGLRAVLEGSAGGEAIASVYLGAEDEALQSAPLHAMAAPKAPSAGALLDASERAVAAARAAGAAPMAAVAPTADPTDGPAMGLATPLAMGVADTMGAPTDPKGASQPAHDAPMPSQDAPAREAPLVLLADDNEVNRAVIAAYLEKSGHRVLTAVNGFEAVRQYREEKPRIAILATELPVMSGIEAARAIRRFEKDKGLPEAPIVGLVEAGQSGVRERGSSAGISDFLAKPASPEDVAAKLSRWIRDKEPESVGAL